MAGKKQKGPARPRHPLAVSLSVIADRNATGACASIMGGHYTADLIQAAGTAKRMAGDTYHPEIGTDLAVGRALLELGLQLIHRGNSLVQLEADTRHAEHLLAAMNETTRALRRMQPHPGLLTLGEVLEQRGLEAAKTAAKRRGLEAELAEMVQNPPSAGRDNGLPTIKSGTEKEST